MSVFLPRKEACEVRQKTSRALARMLLLRRARPGPLIRADARICATGEPGSRLTTYYLPLLFVSVGGGASANGEMPPYLVGAGARGQLGKWLRIAFPLVLAGTRRPSG